MSQVQLPLHRQLRQGPFVGRGEALRELDEASAQHPIVELLGPPGVGKTRLALEWSQRHPAGPARFCDLTEAKTLDSFLLRVAQAMGVEATDRSLDEALRARLGGESGARSISARRIC